MNLRELKVKAKARNLSLNRFAEKDNNGVARQYVHVIDETGVGAIVGKVDITDSLQPLDTLLDTFPFPPDGKSMEQRLALVGRQCDELHHQMKLEHVEIYRGCSIFKDTDGFCLGVLVVTPNAMSVKELKHTLDRVCDVVEDL